MSFLTDGTISLRPVEREDLPQLRDWRNDQEIRLRTREFRPLNMENQERWFQRISSPGSHDFMFIVEHIANQACVGVVGLCAWSARDRTAECSFYIGDTQARGKGYVTRALTLLHDWGFSELGLDRCWAESYDEARTKTLERLGYKREGVLRKHVFRNGKRVDSVMLGLLKEEWTK